jgi:hypothetical protein
MKFLSHLRLITKLTLGIALAAIVGGVLPVPAHAFTVTKDINNAKYDEKVIFQKGMPADHYTFVDQDSSKLSMTADGAIDCRIAGDGEVKAIIKWKPNSGLPATLSTKDYDELVVTCRMEGNIRKTDSRNGKVTTSRPDNLWFGVTIFDASDEMIGSVSLADGTADGKTPDKTVELRFPMSVVTFWGPGGGDIAGVGFLWGKPGVGTSRDFNVVVDKIALAKILPQ